MPEFRAKIALRAEFFEHSSHSFLPDIILDMSDWRMHFNGVCHYLMNWSLPMFNYMKYIIFVLSIFVASLSYADTIAECVNGDPNNVNDVQRCLSRIPSMTMKMQISCSVIKQTYLNAQENVPSEQRKKPSCRTIGDAITNLNGKNPQWYGCIEYDGTQQKLNKCLGSLVNDQREMDCGSVKIILGQGILSGLEDQTNKQELLPSCDMIAHALSANGSKMQNSECLGYIPGDANHMKQCLHALPRNALAQLDCEKARVLHQMQIQLVSANNELPDNYVIPVCEEINAAVVAALSDREPATMMTTSAASGTPEISSSSNNPARQLNSAVSPQTRATPNYQNPTSNEGVTSGQNVQQGTTQDKTNTKMTKLQNGIEIANKFISPNTQQDTQPDEQNEQQMPVQVKTIETIEKVQGHVDTAKKLLNIFGSSK